MGTKIESLLPQQEAELPAVRERWRSVGLSTAPIDADAARDAVRGLYRCAGTPEPAAVIVLASPMAYLPIRDRVGAIGRGRPEGEDKDKHKDFLEQLGLGHPDGLAKFFDTWRVGPLCAYLNVDVTLTGRLLHEMIAPVLNQLFVELREPLVAQLHGQVRDLIAAELRERSGTSRFYDTGFAGGLDAASIGPSDFAERIGVPFDPYAKAHHDSYKAYVLTCGWLYAHEAVAFVTDRPAEIHFDERRRLHSATTMALRFRDGEGLYAWHGTRVPARLIAQRHTISPDSIEAEANAELRRVALEIFGFERYLAVRSAKVIATDELHGQPRQLLEIEVAGTPLRIIEVMNGSLEPDGSRRRFHLAAMPGRTPHECLAASYGIAASHYCEAVRT